MKTQHTNNKPVTFVFSNDLEHAHAVDQETAKFLNEHTNAFTLTPTSKLSVTNSNTVYNIAGTSGDTRYKPSKSWIAWYVDNIGGGPYNCTCKDSDCNDPIYGGHMYVGSYNTKNKWYILPLCNWHNNTSRTGASYPFKVTQGPRTALEIPPKTAVLLREFFDAKARLRNINSDDVVDITTLPSFRDYKRWVSSTPLPQELVESSEEKSSTYTVNIENQSAKPFYFVFSRHKPNNQDQSDVTLAWAVEKVGPYGVGSFQFSEEYSACYQNKVAGSRNYSAGQYYPCSAGSYFECSNDSNGFVSIAPVTPPDADVPSSQINIKNSTNVSQVLGVGINGQVVGYQTDSLPNLTQTFKFDSNMYAYVAQEPVRIGDVVTNQAVGNLVSASDFKNQMTSARAITWTLSPDNILSYSFQ